MNILFLTDNFSPEVNAPASRTFEHCRQWVKLGASVTVITCVPNFPRGKVFAGYKNKLRQVEEREGIKIVRVWSYMTANSGVFRRTIDYASFACTGFISGLFCRADIIVATSPQFFTTWAGWALSILKRRPFIFELRDLWPESIFAVDAVRRRPVINLLENIELFLYRQAEAVVAVTPGLKDNLVQRGIAGKKIHVICNGVDRTLFAPQKRDPGLRRQLGLEGKFVISYIGTHGLAHGLDFIIDSLSQIRNQDIHFLFIGDGAEKKKLQKTARALDLKNCTLLDSVPRSCVPNYLAMSDAALVHLKNREIFKQAIPSKIFEAAAMQRPILLGVEGLARKLIEDYPAGIFFQPENQKSFFQAVRMLQKDSTLYETCREGCNRLADDFERGQKAKEMYRLLEMTCAKKPD